MLLSPVDGIRNKRAGRFAQDVFFRHAANLQVNGHGGNQLHQMMIQERHTPFDGMRHFHSIAKNIQQILGQGEICPEIKRLVDRISPGQTTLDVNTVHQATVGILPGELRGEIIREQGPQFRAAGPLLSRARSRRRRTANA